MALWRFDLNDEEDLIVEQKPHWIMLAAPTMQLLLLVGLAVIGVIVLSFLPSWTALIPLVVVVVVAIRLAIRVGMYRSSRLLLTNERLVVIAGFFGRRVKEIPIAQISNLSYAQGFAQRLLMLGSLQVDHSGEAGRDIFAFVRRPDRIVRMISSQIAKRSAIATSSRAYSPLDELSKLADLRRQGSITQEEYEAAKSRLLNQI